MNIYNQGRYSVYIRPLVATLDLLIVVFFALKIFFESFFGQFFIVLIGISWFLAAYFSKFYNVYRNTKPIQIISLIIKQSALFGIFVFALSGYFNTLNLKSERIFRYVLYVFISVILIKIAVFFLLKKYRTLFNGNYRNVVILGYNKQALSLKDYFNNNPSLGYKLLKTFNKIDSLKNEEFYNFIIDNNINEVYCSLQGLDDKQIHQVISFTENNLISLKFIPDTKNIIFRNFKYEYYNYTPILSLRNIPLDESVNKFIKRLFDFLFSLVVILFVLSWLTPIIAFLIKLESKGPIFFNQSRNGINNKEFCCYKFRSMMPNKEANLNQATKNDMRVTKVGRFIRETSIDELPQFFNVFLGDMSVVGPRPHMVSHTNKYAKSVDKFMVRHFVKPGITGLAQVSGFRGEIESKKDIINRVKYDIFYIENWSLLLDVKIIFLTVYNAIKGEDKAY